MIQFPSISVDSNFCQFPLEYQREPPLEFPPSKLVDSFLARDETLFAPRWPHQFHSQQNPSSLPLGEEAKVSAPLLDLIRQNLGLIVAYFFRSALMLLSALLNCVSAAFGARLPRLLRIRLPLVALVSGVKSCGVIDSSSRRRGSIQLK